MGPTPASVIVAAAILAGAGARPHVPPPQFVSPSSDLVVLPVVVADDDGRLVPDLPPAAFTLYDDGRREPIALFDNRDRPVSIGLVVDESGSMQRKMGEVVAAAVTLARDSNPQDEVFTVTFNDRPAAPAPGSLAATDLPGLEQALLTGKPEGQTALYDALLVALRRLESARHERRVLVVVSDGADNASRSTLADVLDRARRSQVTIYTIGLFDDQDYDTNPRVLGRLAAQSGGRRYLPGSPGGLVQDCRHIARAIRASYLLGYQPRQRDGRYHRISVEVRGPDGRRLEARTRLGYVASGASR
jgi:Ca-activated chloride channel family protein